LGLLVSEDDFSAVGSLDYKAPTVHGQETNLEEFAQNLRQVADMISRAVKERDQVKEAKNGSDSE